MACCFAPVVDLPVCRDYVPGVRTFRGKVTKVSQDKNGVWNVRVGEYQIIMINKPSIPDWIKVGVNLEIRTGENLLVSMITDNPQ